MGIAHTIRTVLALLLIAALSAPAQQKEPLYRFKVDAELVLVNVVVRDKSGAPVRGLTRDDFVVLEDKKPQQVRSFDFEDVQSVSTAAPEQVMVLTQKTEPGPAPAPVENFKDRRLIVLFFDLSSMQPEEVQRAGDAALDFVEKQMTPADLVGVVSLSSTLEVNQDFTGDRELLKQAIVRFSATSGYEGAAAEGESTGEDFGFTADETEYNIFNSDRRLQAIQALSQSLARLEQKKSLIYFSSGLTRTGTENQAQLRAAINAAVRGNVAIYTMDMRGLQAVVPGGSASQASMRGTSAYSGRGMGRAFDSQFSSQETLVTIASDTGGKAVLDSNNFGEVFNKVIEDSSTYYLIGYRSSNAARDGRYRRISVRLRQPGHKLEYRSGYYAPRDFAHSTDQDRELQLDEELNSEMPSTDLPVYLSAAYFRVQDGKYFVPVSLVVPGWEIPFTTSSNKDRAALDVVGIVREARDKSGRVVADVRDTVKLSVEGAQQVRRKNVQYDTGFVLPAGKFHLKFILRENNSGKVGSFESDLEIPDLKNSRLKMSAVVLGSQLKPGAKSRPNNPLIRDGSELVVNVSRVFSASQQMYFYYEVYDPARHPRPEGKAEGKKAPIRLLTNIQFFNGKVKTYETPLVEARELNAPERHAAVFQFGVPLAQLRPGLYSCQVNVIDDAGGTFAFPRLAVKVRP